MDSTDHVALAPVPCQLDIYLRATSVDEARSVAAALRNLTCAAAAAAYRGDDGERWLRVAVALSRRAAGTDLVRLALYVVDALGLEVERVDDGIVQGCEPHGLLVPVVPGLLDVDRALALAPAYDVAAWPLARA